MLSVYNLSIIGILKRALPIHLRDLLLEVFKEALLYLPVNQHVIRSYAGLAAVQIFSKGHSSGRQLQVRRFINNAGTLSSQLQRHGRQVGACLLHDHFPHIDASGKEDIIKLLGKQSLILLSSPFYDSYIFLREDIPQQFRHDG